ncbi:MAG: hypothetical protein IBX62_00535 [Coriobacteriia bacterium]|nr:hypothetical protein [Coriobacteriia bacterium]
MAVARMLRITVFGYRPDLDEVVGRLQNAGAVEVTEERFEQAPPRLEEADLERLRGLDEQIASAQFVRDFLGRYHRMTGRFSTFVSEKVHIARDEYLALAADEPFWALYREAEQLADAVATIERERERLSDVVHDLHPWRDFHLQISMWRGTENVALFTGTVPPSRSEDIRQALRGAVDEVTVAELGVVAERQAWVVMAHRDVVSEVKAVLATTEFEEVSFPGLSDYPAEEISRAEERLGRLDQEEAEAVARARDLSARHYHRSVALVQSLLSRRDAVGLRESFGSTERAFVLKGWVVEAERDALLRELEPVASRVDVSFERPDPSEEPPVTLANPRLIRPFEVLTDLYGRPRYGELDPTPLLAGFFFLFFGMALSDAGYGVVLFAVAWLIKHRLDVADGVKRFMDLLMMGSVATFIVGVATGSYFSIASTALPGPLAYDALIELPIDILPLLVFSVAIGVVHVLVGVLTRAYRHFREGEWADAVLDELSTVFVIGVALYALAIVIGLVPAAAAAPVSTVLLAGFGATVFAKGRVFAAPLKPQGAALWDRALGWAFVALLAAWILAAAFALPVRLGWPLLAVTVLGLAVSRAARAAVVGTLTGLYGVYGLVGFASDFLSYSRLAALGLASFLVGDVMNRLAGLVSGSLPVLGILLAVLIIVVGHAFNLTINLLGAFVHPTRLQYVEFFSKFYEGGGRNFTPFSLRRKSLVLHPSQGRPEGGTGS